ncbi:hypothetical protein BCV69DRAFT_4714 [Microstroma glucosiphilum]|uniref:Uncharacterized protein n=1 Tax=Pseudomicrostroma glucosiphilum TaxID=1684307 RepID=A0A316UEF4_9BASI|nr:hypothetical protein BCV69DRAFT_4714 [Pseudomicrostroma glucosiphilum]PWN23606.1 hypothetical protein BCV69DRAFT_4714 [Pseudomicrostroma glucosiphilum]
MMSLITVITTSYRGSYIHVASRALLAIHLCSTFCLDRSNADGFCVIEVNCQEVEAQPATCDIASPINEGHCARPSVYYALDSAGVEQTQRRQHCQVSNGESIGRLPAKIHSLDFSRSCACAKRRRKRLQSLLRTEVSHRRGSERSNQRWTIQDIRPLCSFICDMPAPAPIK